MKLPEAQRAVIAPAKIQNYLSFKDASDWALQGAFFR
jgi:hypothetical protein